jgi:hypothetical protein
MTKEALERHPTFAGDERSIPNILVPTTSSTFQIDTLVLLFGLFRPKLQDVGVFKPMLHGFIRKGGRAVSLRGSLLKQLEGPPWWGTSFVHAEFNGFHLIRLKPDGFLNDKLNFRTNGEDGIEELCRLFFFQPHIETNSRMMATETNQGKSVFAGEVWLPHL